MAAKLLLPGFGSKYTSEAIAGAGTGVDTIDCARVNQLIFEVTAHSGDATTITVEQSIDLTNWATLTTFNATLGTVKLMASSGGPFGVIRLKANGSSGTNTIQLVGWESQCES